MLAKGPLFLTGFMGCGKTTVGSLVAVHLGISFSDLDQEIERRTCQRIAAIFQQGGESAFRVHEHQVLTQVLEKHSGEPCLIALGGGTWIQPQNRQIIPAERVIFLDTPYPVLRVRVLNTFDRPLVHDAEQLEKLYRERLPIYNQAGIRVQLDPEDDAAAAAAMVLEAIKVLLRGSA